MVHDTSHRQRILFLIGRGGGGHKASARALRDAMPAEIQASVEMVDVGYTLEACLWGRSEPRKHGFDADELYNWLLKNGCFCLAALSGLVARGFANLGRNRLVRALTGMWAMAPPTLVVSFVPFFNGIFRDALHAANPDAAIVTVVTDFANSPEHTWLDPHEPHSARHFIVAGTDTLVSQCRQLGYPTIDVLRSSGMVVHPCFHARPEDAAQASPGVQERALISFGAMPPLRVERIAAALAASQPQLAVVVLCGGNAKLLKRLQRRGDVTALPMVTADEVRRHMRESAFVLGKPGPGTVSEAAACGVAFVTERRGVMAQERDVLTWIEEAGAGVVVDSLTELPADLRNRVAACAPTLRTLKANNRAVFEVRDLVMSLLGKQHAEGAAQACEEGYAAGPATPVCTQRGG